MTANGICVCALYLMTLHHHAQTCGRAEIKQSGRECRQRSHVGLMEPFVCVCVSVGNVSEVLV